MPFEGDSPETEQGLNQHHRNQKGFDVVKRFRDKFIRKPSFPETPNGYSRYYSGWNLEAFQLCFNKKDAMFDKSSIEGPYHADRTYFFPENKRVVLSDFDGSPINAAAVWSLRRQGSHSYGKNYTPIIISGLVESGRINKDDINYFASGAIKVDRVFKVTGNKNKINNLVDITSELLGEDNK